MCHVVGVSIFKLPIKVIIACPSSSAEGIAERVEAESLQLPYARGIVVHRVAITVHGLSRCAGGQESHLVLS